MKKHCPSVFVQVAQICAIGKQLLKRESRFLGLSFSMVLFLAQAAFTQSSVNYTPATGTTGSLVLDLNSNAVDMSSGTTELVVPSSDDVASAVTNIGFDFYFLGTGYIQFSVNSNGYLRFGGTAIVNNQRDFLAANDLITPFGEDLMTHSTGKVHSKMIGTAPSRCLVIEWQNLEIDWNSSTANGTYQLRIYETTGIIEFVYGSMAVADIFGTITPAGARIGFAKGTGVNNMFTVVTPSTYQQPSLIAAINVNNYALGTITDLNSASDGSRRFYTFTPPQASVAAPTTMTFSGVTVSGMTVDWVDNSTNETNFNIYRSTDGTNYSYIATITSASTGATGMAYNYVASGLNGGTTYYWRIVANSEGVPSSPLDGSQATNPCSLSGNITIGATGTYSSVAGAIAALVANGVAGPVVLELQTDYAPEGAITFSFVPCASSTNTITVRPAAGVGAPIVITSAAASPTINFSGGKYFIVDGRNGGTGSNKFITIDNSSTTGQAVQFINDGSNNTIRYCTIQGVATTLTSGVIVFTSTTGTLGNSNNTIDVCEIKDGSSTPTNAVYSAGTAGVPNNGNTISNSNIYNFYNSTSTTLGGVGINLGVNNNNWSISGNSFYQTTTRTTFGSGAIFNAILISSSTVNGTSITGNFIGGTAANCGSTAMTLNTTATLVFRAIQATAGSTTPTTIQGNTIQNIAVTTASTSTAQSLISAITGSFNIGNVTPNTLGSQSITGSFTFTQSTSSTLPIVSGILAGTGTPGVINISNNTIGGINVSNSSTGSLNLRGISVQGSATSYTISGNTIGSTTTANSFSNSSNNSILGIFSASTATTNNTSNNIVANLTQTGTSTGNNLIGILLQGSSGGVFTTTGNTIRNLSSSSSSTSTGSSASVIGISHTAGTTAGQTLAQNTVHSLSNTTATAAVSVTGIYYSGPTTGSNIIARNFVHSLSISSTSATAELNGIRVGAGISTFQNNMIAVGAGVSNACLVNGINETGGTNNFFHNNIYIGGSPAAGSANSLAFNSTVITNVRSYRDNIFVNARSNSGATGKNYAIRVGGTTPNPAGLTLNNNIYHIVGTGTVFGLFNSIDVADLAAWQAAVGQDVASIQADPQYNDPLNSTPDLHIHPTNPTPAEASGADVGVAEDFDGQTRSGLTPVDIGADAGNFVPAPSMMFISSTTTQNNTSNVLTNSSNQEVIGIQIVTAGALNPLSVTSFTLNTNGTTSASDIANAKLFFTASSSTFATGSQFGSTNATPNGSFMINGSQNLVVGTNYFWLTYDVICGATATNVIDAECNSLTVGSAQVPTVQAPAGSRTIIIGPISGTKTVGTGGDYASLSAAAAAINSGGLGGNTTLSILESLTEAGPVTINQWADCGGSGFTLTIKPAAATTPTISTSSSTAVINLNGADYITIDGSNNGTSSKDMTIRNTGTGSAIRLIEGATFNMIKNSVVESQNANASGSGGGTILFSTSTGISGNSNNTINNCDIRDRSDMAGVPAIGVNSFGTNSALNANNTISGCRIFNWTTAGVLVSSTGVGNGWTINPTSFYQTASRTTALTAISIQGGSGHSILNNSIGGSAADRSGNPITTTTTFTGISLSVGTTSPTSVQGNTISNLNISGGTTQTFKGIQATAGNVNIGTLSGNIIGGAAAVYDTIRVSYDSDMIEYTIGTGIVMVENNTIGNIAYYRASGDRLFGIRGMDGTVSIKNNIIRDLKSNSSGTGFTFFPGGIWLATTVAGANVEGNQVYDISQMNAGTSAYTIAGIYVASVSSSGMATTVHKNKVYNITAAGTGTGTSSPRIFGIDIASGSATYHNNMIALGSSVGNESRIHGIEDVGSGANNYYFNTISVSGTTGSGANNSYAFRRSGTATVSILDNIFSNTRTGGTGFHVAIANTNASATGWAIGASNYNDLYNSTPANLAQWLGSAVGNNRDLPGWQAAQAAGTPGSEGDINSLNVAPIFSSITDLHLTPSNVSLDNFGTPAGGITADFDGDTRSVTTPDMGADEFGVPCAAIVTNTNDSGAGSLRDVVSCAAPDATIIFNLPPLSLITLTTGEILITKNLTITGLDSVNLILSGNNASRIFHIQTGRSLTVKYLSMKNATAPTNGGAIFVEGNLTLEDVLFQNNYENGLTTRKSMTIVNPTGNVVMNGLVQLKE